MYYQFKRLKRKPLHQPLHRVRATYHYPPEHTRPHMQRSFLGFSLGDKPLVLPCTLHGGGVKFTGLDLRYQMLLLRALPSESLSITTAAYTQDLGDKANF